MNEQNHTGLRIAANAVGILGTFLIVAGLIWVMYHYTQAPAVEEAHWAERQKNLADLTAQNKELLGTPAWIDQRRGVVRLPIDRAMELTASEWQNPALGRSNLLARLAQGTPPASTATTNSPAATNTPPAAPSAKRP
jgi:hypothetical protein